MVNPKISIIVPVYKVEDYLDRCVQSLLNQSYQNLEIILVNDGSPDNCPALCDAYAREEDKIQVIHQPNGGLSRARNSGLKKATGDYVLYVDSDDYLSADACQNFVDSLPSEQIDIIIGICEQVSQTSTTYLSHTHATPNKIYEAKEFVIGAIQSNEWYAPACFNLYRRQFLIDNNLFFKEGALFEDMQMLPRLFLAADKVVYMDKVFYYYILRDNSIMTSNDLESKKEPSLNVYRDWQKILSTVDDDLYLKYLNGVLVKYYLSNCRAWKIEGWQIKGLDFKFAWKYALNTKERLKVLYFNYFPKQYIK